MTAPMQVNLIVPSVKNYSDCREFFRDFVVMNKAADSKRSRRFLAKKLGWPVPFFDQLIRGEKQLTLRRCVEFIEAVNLDDPAGDRLIQLALLRMADQRISAYASRKLGLGNSFYSSLQQRETIQVNPIQGFYCMLITELANLRGSVPTFAQLIKDIPALSVLDTSMYDECVAMMKREMVLISEDGEKVKPSGKDLRMGANSKDSQTEWDAFLAESFKLFRNECNYPRPKSAHCHGFGIVADDRMQELKDRLFELVASMSSVVPPASGSRTLLHFGFSINSIAQEK